MNKEFSNRLIEARKQRGFNATALAKKSGISKSHLSQLESGKGTPSEHVIKVISMICSVNEHWLRTGEGEMVESSAVKPDTIVAETRQAYSTPRASIGRLMSQAAEVLESEDAVLVMALSQNIEAFHRALQDARVVRKSPDSVETSPEYPAAGGGAATGK
jgi:transcriptional regulator with XRE-family HTH domain